MNPANPKVTVGQVAAQAFIQCVSQRRHVEGIAAQYAAFASAIQIGEPKHAFDTWIVVHAPDLARSFGLTDKLAAEDRDALARTIRTAAFASTFVNVGSETSPDFVVPAALLTHFFDSNVAAAAEAGGYRISPDMVIKINAEGRGEWTARLARDVAGESQILDRARIVFDAQGKRSLIINGDTLTELEKKERYDELRATSWADGPALSGKFAEIFGGPMAADDQLFLVRSTFGGKGDDFLVEAHAAVRKPGKTPYKTATIRIGADGNVVHAQVNNLNPVK